MNTAHPVRVVQLVAALILLAAALSACSGLTQVTEPSTQEPIEVERTEPPTQEPIEPTATEEPTITPTPVPPGITLDNAGDVVEQRVITVARSLLTAVEFSPTSHDVATFGFDKTVRVYDADSGELTHTLGNHGDWGMALAWSPDGGRLISAARGSDIIIWDMEDNDNFRSLITNPTRVYDIDWSRDGQLFATGGESSSRLTIFDRDGNQEQEIRLPDGWIWSIAFSDDYLAVGHDVADTVFVYDVATYGLVEELPNPTVPRQPAGELDFSPDGSLLLGCFRDGNIVVWDTSDWSEVNRWSAHPRAGNAVGCLSGTFTLNGQVYISGGDDGNVMFWDAREGTLLNSFEYGVLAWSISLSGDGELVAVGLDNGTLHILGLP